MVSAGILVEASWYAFKAIAERISADAMFNRVSSAEEAIDLSKYRVLMYATDCSHDDVVVLDAVEQDDVWTVTLETKPSGDLYVVDTSTTSSGCPVSRIRRKEFRFPREEAEAEGSSPEPE
jgi:hypothetical protein